MRSAASCAMDYSSCSITDQLTLRAAAGPEVNAVVKVDDDDDCYQNVENGVADDDHNVTNADEASIIDEYFGFHDLTTTSGSGGVIVPEIPRAYDADAAHWLDQSPTTPSSGPAVTSQPRLFASSEDICARKYYDEFADMGAYRTSAIEVRPPPSYPTKREDKLDEEALIRSSECGNLPRLNKLYTGSYSSADAYLAHYGSSAFPLILDQGQYGGGVATGGVLNDARQQYYGTGNGNGCAGYLSVDIGGFGQTMLRPIGLQSSTAAWPPAL